MDEFIPPAIVRSSRAELEQEVKGLWGDFQRMADGLGKKLSELREQCSAGEWYPLLEKIGIPKSTATKLIRKFKGQDEDTTATCSGSTQEESAEEEIPQTPEEPAEDDRGDAWEQPPEPDPPSNPAAGKPGFAPAYARNGYDESKRGNGKSGGRKPAAATEEAAPKAGSELFNVKQFETPFGQLVRVIDELGNAYKAKESTEAQQLRGELRKFKEQFTGWLKKLTGGKK